MIYTDDMRESTMQNLQTEMFFIAIGDEVQLADCKPLFPLISKERLEKIHRLADPVAKKQCLYSELIIRWLACKKLDVPSNVLWFGAGEHGKPCLRDFPYFQFNVSHTRGAMAAAVSPLRVGVDIEAPRRFSMRTAKRCFSQQELAYLEHGQDQMSRFLNIWTRKEAHLKRLGIGIRMPLRSFSVLDTDTAEMLKTIKMGDFTLSISAERLPCGPVKVIEETKLLQYGMELAGAYSRK